MALKNYLLSFQVYNEKVIQLVSICPFEICKEQIKNPLLFDKKQFLNLLARVIQQLFRQRDE
jgi:hypothetical protein